MRDQEIESRFRKALENASPDMIDGLMEDLPPQDSAPPEDTAAKGSKPRRGRIIRLIAAAAAAVAVAVGVYSYLDNLNSSVRSVVGLDVNPSIELMLNRRDEVVEAAALNNDGIAILDGMDLKGTGVDVAVNAIIGSMLKNGYISELANSVLITVESDDPAQAAELQQRVSDEVNTLLSATSSGGAVISQTIGNDAAVAELAAQYGISQGKVVLIQQILASTAATNTFEELAGLSINELALLLSNPVVDSSGVEYTGTASDKAYIGADAAAQAALERAAVSREQITELEVEFDHDDGRMVYDVEFKAGGDEYEIEIDALTGDVVKFEFEPAEPSWSHDDDDDDDDD